MTKFNSSPFIFGLLGLGLFAPLSLKAAPKLISSYLISPDSKISIIFDHAMVNTGDIDKKKNNTLLKITPNWNGEIIWSAENKATFIPTEKPRLNTEYVFETTENLSDLNGKKIKLSTLGKHRTPDFKIQRSRKLDSISSSKRPRLFISFNDDITPNKLAGFFFYQSKSGKKIAAEVTQATYGDINRSYYATPSWVHRWDRSISKRNDKELKPLELEAETILSNAIIVRPIDTLPAGEKWNLLSLEGIKNSATTAKIDSSDSFSIGTKNPFSLQAAKPIVIANKPRYIQLDFNAPLKEKITKDALKSSISVNPQPENLKIEVEDNKIYLRADFSKKNQYTVKVDHSISGQHGLALSQSFNHKITFEHLAPSMAIPSFSTAQLSKGACKYPISTINMESLRIRIKALDLTQAIRARQGFDQFIKDQISLANGKQVKRAPLPFSLVSGDIIYEQNFPINNAIDTSDHLTLDWKNILPKNKENLVFFLDIQGTPKQIVAKKSTGDHHAQTFIQLTDIGLAWKVSQQDYLIYCYSCDTGKPLSNVTIQTFGEDAKKIIEITTDTNGIAKLAKDQNASHLVASMHEDRYIIPLKKDIETVALWRFPVQYDWHKFHDWKRESLIFTDRKLYKPGETVHLKGIVREKKDNQHRIPKERSATLSVYDSHDRILVDKEITLSEHGSFDHTIKLPEKNVGRHRIQLDFKIPKEQLADETHPNMWSHNWKLRQNATFNSYFNVQEFRKNAFKVASKLTQKEHTLNTLKASISANYYTKNAVSEGNVIWYLNSITKGFYPSKYSDFYFGNHLNYDPHYWDHYYGLSGRSTQESNSNEWESGTAKLNKEGLHDFEHTFKELEVPSPKSVTLITEVTDGREQTITSRSTITVHPSSHYIGIARIDKLLRVGNHQALNFVLVDNQGKPSEIPLDANITITKTTFKAVKIKSPSGEVSIKNEANTQLFLEDKIKLASRQPNIIKFHPDQAGQYNIAITAKDPQGNLISSAMKCQVYGSDEYPWAVNTGMKIDLVPEKKHYLPGDTARILVQTPIEGTALVTVERSGVTRSYRRELTTADPVIEIPVEHQDAPNVYVSVMLIRGSADSPLKYKEPALKLGYCNLNVENQKDRLQVTINPPEESYLPNQQVTLTGSVKDFHGNAVENAEVTFYVEDNGVLDVVGYNMPRPLKYFNSKLSLLVESGTSLHTFLKEIEAHSMDMENHSILNKGFTIGGGDDGANQQLITKFRKNFDPCAVWSPTLKTKNDGTFSITFHTPDSLSSYRVMAVVSSGASKFGSSESSIIVSKPLILKPLAPRFANEGDTKVTKLMVLNNSKYSGEWNVSLTTGSLTSCINSKNSRLQSKIIKLDAGESTYLNFETHFENTGQARWQWQATPVTLTKHSVITPELSVKLSDAMENTFPVLYPRPILRGSQYTQVRKSESSVLDQINPALLDGRGRIELVLSNNLLFKSRGASKYLLKYPYGCVEQTSSSLTPWFAVKELKPYIPQFAETSDQKIKTAIQKGANRLLSMQTSDGGLAYWPGGSSSTDWASSTGGHALILAKINGAEVPQEAIDQLCNYLQKNLKTWIARDKNWDYQTVARSLYTLALVEKAKQSDLNFLFGKRDNLCQTARCYLSMAIHESNPNNNDAFILLEEPKEVAGDEKKHWMRFKTAEQLRLLAFCKVSPKSELIHKLMETIIAKQSQRGHWGSTWANAATISAMAEYAKVVKNNPSTTIFTVTVNGESETHKVNQSSPTHTLTYPIEKAINITVSSDAPSYANTMVYSKPNLSSPHPISRNGMAIQKKYYRILNDGTREKLTNPRVGDLVEIELSVTFADRQQYVVIDDPLPGTFECVNSDFASQSTHVRGSSDQKWNVSHQELRDDRALFFLNSSWSNNTQQLSYLARITSSGEVTSPAAKVEAMYDPDSYGLTGTYQMQCAPREK